MVAPVYLPTYSAEEYLHLEVNSEFRHEYIDGAMIPMTGGTPNHNRLVRNLCTLLTTKVESEYEIFVTDQRLWIPEYKAYIYPDVMVVKGGLILQEGRKDTITNPRVIIEVLSKSTENYDPGRKFDFYRAIPSLQEYFLVGQYTYVIQRYGKISQKKWEFEAWNAPQEEIKFSSIPCALSLGEIYHQVTFEVPPDGK